MVAVPPPNTTSQLSHAVTIRVNGVTVGAINEWNPRMNQTVTELYELGVVTPGGGPAGTTAQYSKLSGEPFEKVPGNVSGMQVDVRRYDIYTLQMEQAFGTPNLHMLSNQRNAFNIVESWLSPNNAKNYFNHYQGCWFSDLGRTISATGDRIINVNATLQYTRRDIVPI
ncbi:hypothetical protein Rctr197k_067 [Virus Rctr197k]|nr:hypothetical protein Rctr197k_067 [Virus Rctr197k]